ncbi:S-adenosyl-L-methionine-dependent methyltransferase [Zychaea mexicana]|uniref:S-adenosyl-L-methionine-dependent methyltransferase n=1 Tax=Zychaea mexicana TaxID=64656 RepID=UPI0022FF1570|nr:S-adenosyl-L-methionine-dependent methyltransferase [Zychaea mexicana]KAI9496011.1 S-adenosyl-L-methionine-dependent methyltransferase [Zychaea mexicana]
MPRRLWRHQDSRWIRRLLPACDNDVSLARRQLTWLKEKTRNPTLLDRHVYDRVVRHKPLQYILGTQPFGDLEIVTRPPVLIPRWETEEWVHRLIDILLPHVKAKSQGAQERPFRVLDICTGSGCIALALAAHLPPHRTQIIATDISDDAIALAQHNYHDNKSLIQNHVDFQQVDVFSDAMQRMDPFDLIVSNPPYITFDDYKDLDPDVKQWEDVRALVADEDGMAVHRRIVELASNGLLLRSSKLQRQGKGESSITTTTRIPIPRLAMEFGGTHQAVSLKRMMKPMLNDVQVWKDLAGKDRVVVGA